MNVYFACSVIGGRQDEDAYRAIVRCLLEAGHDVPTAHLSRPDVLDLEADASPDAVYRRAIAWLDACDAVVAEVSTPSHGVGYELAYALGLGKPALCCYQAGRRVSTMISGNARPTLRLLAYQTPAEAAAGVERFLREVTPHL